MSIPCLPRVYFVSVPCLLPVRPRSTHFSTSHHQQTLYTKITFTSKYNLPYSLSLRRPKRGRVSANYSPPGLSQRKARRGKLPDNVLAARGGFPPCQAERSRSPTPYIPQLSHRVIPKESYRDVTSPPSISQRKSYEANSPPSLDCEKERPQTLLGQTEAGNPV